MMSLICGIYNSQTQKQNGDRQELGGGAHVDMLVKEHKFSVITLIGSGDLMYPTGTTLNSAGLDTGNFLRINLLQI